VQVFDGNGKYETQWNNLHRPCALCCLRRQAAEFHHRRARPRHGGQSRRCPISARGSPSSTPRESVSPGFGGENVRGLEAGKFLGPAGIALDSKGDIYVGEVGVTDWKTSFPDTDMPAQLRVEAVLCRN